MNDYKLDLEKYATLARQAAAEGCVLLENEKQALPLREGESVAVFGRMAFHYYKYPAVSHPVESLYTPSAHPEFPLHISYSPDRRNDHCIA